MTHVTRTQRVDLGQLCERINLDETISIKYINTKSQTTDILTEGQFTVHGRNRPISLFNLHAEVTRVSERQAPRNSLQR